MLVRSLSCEDLLEEEMATCSQYSCLENSMGRRACWATVHEVSKIQTQPRECSVVACRIQFPDQRSNPGPLHQQCQVLANGPPGKSPYLIFKWMMVDIKSLLYVYFIGYIYDIDIIVLFLNVKICNVQKLHLLYLFNT